MTFLRKYWIWILITIILIPTILQVTGVIDLTSPLADFVERGARMTNAPAGDDGIVPGDPVTLASNAGNLDVEIYSLARMIRSEEGNASQLSKVAVAYCCLNQAKRVGKTVTQLLTMGTRGKGQYGAQNTGGRYASTAQDPYESDVAIAGTVIGGLVDDPTGGATQFDSPAAQNALAARGTAGYTMNADDVAATRLKSSDLVVVDGIPENKLRFWKPRA